MLKALWLLCVELSSNGTGKRMGTGDAKGAIGPNGSRPVSSEGVFDVGDAREIKAV